MVNGPHSGMALIGLLAVLAVRYLSAQRRRRPGRPGVSRGFTAGPGPQAGAGDPADVGIGGTSPGWFRDPFVRHEQRYWSGAVWTEHVQDDGVPGVDPPPPPRRRDG